MAISQPIMVLDQNPLGVKVYLGQGSKPCPNCTDTSQVKFLHLVTSEKNGHLKTQFNSNYFYLLFKNILFNTNCRPSNIHSLHTYGVRQMCFFVTQCMQSPPNSRYRKALEFSRPVLQASTTAHCSTAITVRRVGLDCSFLA